MSAAEKVRPAEHAEIVTVGAELAALLWTQREEGINATAALRYARAAAAALPTATIEEAGQIDAALLPAAVAWTDPADVTSKAASDLRLALAVLRAREAARRTNDDDENDAIRMVADVERRLGVLIFMLSHASDAATLAVYAAAHGAFPAPELPVCFVCAEARP